VPETLDHEVTHTTGQWGRALAVGQGLYYAATGVWPLLSRRSFEAVTGRKKDWWLVQTVGVLVTTVGVTLTTAGASGRIDQDLRRLAAASALGLAAIDVVHAGSGRISKVYLLDAVAELALAAGWLALRLARCGADGSFSGAGTKAPRERDPGPFSGGA
jgi:hypothetical protein